jgi:hypothetical protein
MIAARAQAQAGSKLCSADDPMMLTETSARKLAVVAALGVGLACCQDKALAHLKLFPDQCEAALSIAEEVKATYDMSPRLLASFEKFRRSGCDISMSFERDTKTDVLAFGEFKLRFEMWRTCTDNPVAKVCRP